jgi:hypothetical protein
MGIDFVTADFEQVGDAAPAPAAMIESVHEHESLPAADLG